MLPGQIWKSCSTASVVVEGFFWPLPLRMLSSVVFMVTVQPSGMLLVKNTYPPMTAASDSIVRLVVPKGW